uniref:F-box domain-containing protein n=1 Tax=Arcella intermedia TaxID=1963864 RepID=A0A6B2LE57_9EUKA
MRIFGALTLPDITSVSSVCKDWYDVSSDNTLWQAFSKAYYPSIPTSEHVVSWKREFQTKGIAYRLIRQQFSQMHSIRMAQRHWMMCGVHMFHPVNGRRGFDLLPPPPPEIAQHKPPVDTMIKMLKREDELRLSEEFQKKFAQPDLNTIHVASEIQEQVVKEFGFEDVKVGVELMRTAPSLYPESQQVRRIPHYQKFNRAKDGALKEGSRIPNSKVALINGINISLHQYLDNLIAPQPKPIPVVLISGSYS